jgi:hypothetical protein
MEDGWDHCMMLGNKLYYLGAGLFEDKRDMHLTKRGAWDQIRDEGWELVSVVYDPKQEELVHYFKRPRRAD